MNNYETGINIGSLAHSGKNHVFQAIRKSDDTPESFSTREAIAELKRNEMSAIVNLNDASFSKVLNSETITKNSTLTPKTKRELAKLLGNRFLSKQMTDGNWAYLLSIKLLQNPEIKDSLKLVFEHLSSDQKGKIIQLIGRHGHINALDVIMDLPSFDKGYLNKKNKNLLHFLSPLNAYSSVEKLKNSSIAFDKQSSTGKTPLMLAAVNNSIEVINSLIETDSGINKQDEYGMSALMFAVENNNIDSVKALLSSNDINLNLQNKYGRSAIFYAVENDNVDIVELLVDAGADYNVIDNYKSNVLHLAAQNGLDDLVYFFMEEIEEKGLDPVNLDVVDLFGYTPLLLAALNGHEDIAEELVSYGANVHDKTFLDNNALDLISNENIRKDLSLAMKLSPDTDSQKNRTDLVDIVDILSETLDSKDLPRDIRMKIQRFIAEKSKDGANILFEVVADNSLAREKVNQLIPKLLNQGVDVNANKEGFTILGKLFLNNFDPTLIQLAVNSGTNVNTQSRYSIYSPNNYQSPLFMAAGLGDLDTLKLILGKGADPKIPNDNEYGYIPLFNSSNKDIARILFDKSNHFGLDYHAKKIGRTILHAINENANIPGFQLKPLMDFLIKEGADPKAKTRSGSTPLDFTSSYDLSKMRSLLENGASANSKDDDGKTPLYKAVEDERFAAVELLLRFGAKKDIEMNDGDTAKDLARKKMDEAFSYRPDQWSLNEYKMEHEVEAEERFQRVYKINAKLNH